jgi:hypothetical protein
MRRSSKLYEPADCQLNPAEPAAAAASTQQYRRPKWIDAGDYGGFPAQGEG